MCAAKSPFERLLQQNGSGKTPASVEQWYTPRSENTSSGIMAAAAAIPAPSQPTYLPPQAPTPLPPPPHPPSQTAASSPSTRPQERDEFDEFYPAASYVAAGRRYALHDQSPPTNQMSRMSSGGSQNLDFSSALMVAGAAGVLAAGLLFFMEPPMVHISDPQNPLIKTDVDLRKIGMWGMGVFASVLVYRVMCRTSSSSSKY